LANFRHLSTPKINSRSFYYSPRPSPRDPEKGGIL
jgi:hypothetical protein